MIRYLTNATDDGDKYHPQLGHWCLLEACVHLALITEVSGLYKWRASCNDFVHFQLMSLGILTCCLGSAWRQHADEAQTSPSFPLQPAQQVSLLPSFCPCFSRSLSHLPLVASLRTFCTHSNIFRPQVSQQRDLSWCVCVC